MAQAKENIFLFILFSKNFFFSLHSTIIVYKPGRIEKNARGKPGKEARFL